MAVPNFTTGAALIQSDLQYMITSKPVFYAYLSVAGSISLPVGASDQAIPLDTEVIDRYGAHAPGSTSYRIGVELGWYMVSGQVAFTFNSTGQRTAVIYKNGFPLVESRATIQAALALNAVVRTATIFVNSATSTDYIELRGLQNSGSTLATSTDSNSYGLCSMTVEYLGP